MVGLHRVRNHILGLVEGGLRGHARLLLLFHLGDHLVQSVVGAEFVLLRKLHQVLHEKNGLCYLAQVSSGGRKTGTV